MALWRVLLRASPGGVAGIAGGAEGVGGWLVLVWAVLRLVGGVLMSVWLMLWWY